MIGKRQQDFVSMQITLSNKIHKLWTSNILHQTLEMNSSVKAERFAHRISSVNAFASRGLDLSVQIGFLRTSGWKSELFCLNLWRI